ncbi:MAG: hypothetical protein ACLTZY_11015 [Alistipes indistinctus]
MATQAWCGIARSPQAINTLYELWDDERLANRMLLGENDLTNLSYTLALRFPDRAAAIIARQGARITNPDRQKQYAYIAPAVSPSASVRDSVFHQPARPGEPEHRTVGLHATLPAEPSGTWRPFGRVYPSGTRRVAGNTTYGGYFLPRKWTAALLGSQHSEAARYDRRCLHRRPSRLSAAAGQQNPPTGRPAFPVMEPECTEPPNFGSHLRIRD